MLAVPHLQGPRTHNHPTYIPCTRDSMELVWSGVRRTHGMGVWNMLQEAGQCYPATHATAASAGRGVAFDSTKG